MTGQFVWGAAMVMLVAVVLSDTFPGHRPASPPPALMTVVAQTSGRDAAPAVCREGQHPSVDAGGLAVSC